ncbi:hypothetical protein NKR23_g1550 [Pleurostoma richardsiae]|uniref:Phosphatidylinositol transfer protein SFH5 n=1 Tax=Pleurostoma richardsiae TaxID=41990 RepID=A0AA38RRE0_9PEZI|nr:hypothetical protein NKR23_g1550 [Pleurostoma richardsiae]
MDAGTRNQRRLSLHMAVPGILETADYSEMWGIELDNRSLGDIPYRILLKKFLRANDYDTKQTAAHLLAALQWRKRHRPREGLGAVYAMEKFRNVGVVMSHAGQVGDPPPRTIITWNMYGKAPSQKDAFEDITDFIYWRTALMEKGIDTMGLRDATTFIPPNKDEDPYQMIQVHDCAKVEGSFFSTCILKSALENQCKVFSIQYPELMSHTYIVNAPIYIGYSFKTKIARLMDKSGNGAKLAILKGGDLAKKLGTKVAVLPEAYGGKKDNPEIN